MRTLYIHGSADHYGSAKILLNILRIPGNAEKATVVLPHDGHLVKDLHALNIPVHIMNLGVLRRRYMTPWGMMGRLFLWISAIIRLKMLIRKAGIEHVYVNSANVIVGPALKKKDRVILSWHIHEIVHEPALLTKMLAWLFSKADRLIAVSKATRDFWLAQLHAQAKKNKPIALLYNGLDTTPFESAVPNRKKYCPSAGEGDLIIGMIGRVQPWKGQSYFLDILEAFFATYYPAKEHSALGSLIHADSSNNIDNTGLIEIRTIQVNRSELDKGGIGADEGVHQERDKPRVFAVIAGDAYPGYEHLEEELTEDIKRRNLQERVFYNGYVAGTPEWMASIDLLVLPSTSPDPLPTVVLEAMASSKPVLATSQGGALEMVVEHETGLFMPLNNAPKAAAILTTMIGQKSTLARMGKNANLRVNAQFSNHAFEQGFCQLLGK